MPGISVGWLMLDRTPKNEASIVVRPASTVELEGDDFAVLLS